jgi:hypothetical protein
MFVPHVTRVVRPRGRIQSQRGVWRHKQDDSNCLGAKRKSNFLWGRGLGKFCTYTTYVC